jgi:hypothetical protein
LTLARPKTYQINFQFENTINLPNHFSIREYEEEEKYNNMNNLSFYSFSFGKINNPFAQLN